MGVWGGLGRVTPAAVRVVSWSCGSSGTGGVACSSTVSQHPRGSVEASATATAGDVSAESCAYSAASLVQRDV